MKKLFLLLLPLILLAGCATQAEKQALAKDHYTAQESFVKTASDARKPIFELEGVNGQAIELKNVKALRVWGGNDQAQTAFQAAPVQKSEVVEALGIVKDTALGLAPFALGRAVVGGMVNMGNSIERAGVAGHGAVTTTTNNANQANTTTTLGNNSVNGSGSVSFPATTSTTTTTTTSSNNPLTQTCATGPC